MTQLFEENDLIGMDYAEPYAGGAGLALRLMMEEYVSDIYINDLDPCIYAFWYTVLNDPDSLCTWIENVPVTVEQWHHCKKVLANYKTANIIELGESTFFLNRTNVSGVISGGIIGGYNQTGKYRIDARFNKNELINRIKKITRFSKRIHLSNYDGIQFIEQIEKIPKSIFIYLDPPYYKKGSDLYMNAFCDEDHRKLSELVKKLKKKWIISYDNQEFILQLYKEYKRVRYSLAQCTSNRIGDEILILHDSQKCDNSLKQLNQAKVL